MSDTNSVPTINTQALWTWNTSGATSGIPATIIGFPPGGSGQITKTALTPVDLQNFVGVPLVYYGSPSVPVPYPTMLQWIRWAEDWVERETGLLLAQSWVAAPPTIVPGSSTAIGINPASQTGMQIQGIDYDVYDPPYDFFFPRAEDAGWMAYQLRYRPVKSVSYSSTDFNGVKRWSYIYPLLSEFFRVPPNWIVTDEDMGFVRIVPSANVQLLPLFALYLGFMAFTDSLPGGLWLQYTAGLTKADYTTRYSFIPQLVLAQAAVTALNMIQGTINLGFMEQSTRIDGLDYRTKFDPDGPYSGLIAKFEKMRDELLVTAKSKVSGPMIAFL